MTSLEGEGRGVGGLGKRKRIGGSNIPPELEEEEEEASKDSLLGLLKAAAAAVVTNSPPPSSSSCTTAKKALITTRATTTTTTSSSSYMKEPHSNNATKETRTPHNKQHLYALSSSLDPPSKDPPHLTTVRYFRSTDSRFNDSVTADVNLHVYLESPNPSSSSSVHLYLHSDVLLRRSPYFSALLSDRWQREEGEEDSSSSSSFNGRVFNLTYKVPSSIETHLKVIELLYSTDDNFSEAINSVSTALSLHPVAMEFLFEDCVKACLRFIEAFPWSEEEEQKVLSLAPLLNQEESLELLSRVSPVKNDSHVNMLHHLMGSLTNNHPGLSCQKALVTKLMRDFTSRDSVESALDQAFQTSLNDMKELLKKHPHPTAHICNTVRRNLIHLCWLVEGMLDFRSNIAVNRWSDGSFTQNLQKVFCNSAFKSYWVQFVPQLIQGTCRLSNAVAFGPIVADRKVRKELVTHWLPILFTIRDVVLLALPDQKRFCQQLEETFLKIISTLSLSDSQALLELIFCNYNVEDSPHLLSAFKTWFRRAATQPPTGEGLS